MKKKPNLQHSYKTKLQKKSIIRGLLAGIMLGLFAFSITPKIIIHALVVHHKDITVTLNDGKTDQYNKAGFHCNCDNLVVELPYLYYPISLQLVAPESFKTYQIRADHQFYYAENFIFGLRGPPFTA